MSLKPKLLGPTILALAAVSATLVVNASANTSGHFTAELAEHHLIVKGTESRKSGTHALSLYGINSDGTTGAGQPIQCTHADYHGTLSGSAATTTQTVQIRPKYFECQTGGGAVHDVTVEVPVACGTNVFELTSGGNGTMHLRCTITIKHPNCTIAIPPQTVSGISYALTVESEKLALTLNVNVRNIVGNYHGGACVFLGTPHLFELVGSVTAWGENTAGGRVSILHT
jgi:hypothetical protein